MQKFLKVTHDGMPHLIPLDKLLGIEKPSGTGKVIVFVNSVGHRATGASEVLGYEITASSANDAAKTKEQLVKLAELIEDAYKLSWHKPVLDITALLPYAVTGIAQIEAEWSA